MKQKGIKMTQLLNFIEINPAKTPKNCIIWMHGLGADGHDFVPVVEQLNLPENLSIRFVFPHAPLRPVTINNGYTMRAWYDITSLSLDQRIDQKGIVDSMMAIHTLIQQEVGRGIPSEKIILGGFSQGAVMSIAAGLSYSQRLGGILALSGYPPSTDSLFAQASTANRSTPIFLAHGTQDSVVPFFLGEMLKNLLDQHGYSVNWHSYPIAHSVSAEEIMDIKQWISKTLSMLDHP